MKTSPQFPNVNDGILVPEVSKGSPAERAGFQPGDVIVGFQGECLLQSYSQSKLMTQGCKGEVTTGGLIEELGRHIGVSLRFV